MWKTCVGNYRRDRPAHLPMCMKNIHCLCTPVFGLVEQLLNTKPKRWGCQGLAHEHTHTLWAPPPPPPPRIYAILGRSEGMTKPSETRSSHSSLCVSLSSCLTHTHTHTRLGYRHLPPCGLTHLSSTTRRVSRFSGDATSSQWAAVRTVRERGGNSPPLSLLSTWEPPLPQGGAPPPPAARRLNEHQTKTLATRWVTRVSVVVFCFFSPWTLYFSPSPICFFLFSLSPLPRPFMTGTLLYVEKKSEENPEVRSENKQVECGNFSLFLFSGSRSFYQH